MLCAVVRAALRCCVCALPGLCVARAPCPSVLLRRRGDTPPLWRARMAPWSSLSAPGCGPVRGSGVCVRGGGGWAPLPSPSPPCPSVPFRRPALPAYPLRTRSVCLGWMVGLGGLTWCFFPAARRGFGSLWGVACLCGPLRRVYGVLGHLAPVHRCARSVYGVVCAASWATWLLYTGVRALVCHAVCTVSWASWLPFTDVQALRAVLCVRRLGPPGSCSPVCTLCVWCHPCGVLGRLAPVHRCVSLGVLCRVHGVLGLLAPVHQYARCVCGVVGAAPWASRFLFSGVRARCVVLFVPFSGPRGSCSPACTLCVRCRVCGLLGFVAPVFWCARVVCVVWRVFCPGTLGSCSLVCSVCMLPCVAVCVVFSVRCCVCGFLGLPAPGSPVRTLGLWCCVRLVSWASRLLFTGVFVWCVVWYVRRARPSGSCSLVCVSGALCGMHAVLGLVAPVHRCACSMCGVLCVVSWASWLLCTGVLSWCVVRCVRCPGPLGSCSPVCALGVQCFVFGVLGLLAPVHRCACVVCCVVCTVSWASWILFTDVHARCAVFCAWCLEAFGSCSPACFSGVLCGVCGVLGHLAPVQRCARSVLGVLCLMSWASWLLFTGVSVLCGVCGVLGHLAPVRRCTRVACGVLRVRCPGPRGSCSLVLVLCVVCCVRCPGPRGSCSPVCMLRVVCGVCGVVVGVCSRVPYRPRCIFRRSQE